MVYGLQSLCLLLGAIGSGADAADVGLPWLGPNLAPNPGFEVADKSRPDMPAHWKRRLGPNTPEAAGAACALDRNVTLTGRCAARVTSTTSGGSTSLVSDLVPVEPGASYFFAVAHRQTGFNTRAHGKEGYEGVGGTPRLVWLDARRRRVRGQWTRISRFPYGPSQWAVRDTIDVAPPEARFVRIEFYLANRSKKRTGRTIPATLWLDHVQFRRYHPPPTPAWATGPKPRIVDGASDTSPFETYFLASDRSFRRRGGKWSRVVIDPKAERGSALESPPGVGVGIMASSPYNPHLPAGMGVYRLRLRAAAVADTPPGKRLGFVQVHTERTAYRLRLPIRRRPDVSTGDYAVYEGDFILRDNGWWNLAVYTEGGPRLRVDTIRVIPLVHLTDQRLSALYPSHGDDLPPTLTPPTFAVTTDGPSPWARAMVVAGVGYDWYRLSEAFVLLDRRVEVTPFWVSKARTPVIKGLPESSVALFDYPVVCLCNVRMTALPLAYRRAVRTYVARGGALIVMAGHQSYERGAVQGSWIEDVLPVVPAPSIARGYLHRDAGWLLRPDPAVDWLQWVKDAPNLAVYTMHRVELKPNATVFVWAGTHPFAVGGTYGKGRVLCVLGQPVGSPSSGTSSGDRVPFWKWTGWPQLLRDLVWWALDAHPSLE